MILCLLDNFLMVSEILDQSGRLSRCTSHFHDPSFGYFRLKKNIKKIFEFFFQLTEITHKDIPKDIHKFKIVYRNFFEKATPTVIHRAIAIYSHTPKQGLERAINEPRRVPLKKSVF